MTRTHPDTEALHVPPADPPPRTPWGIVAPPGQPCRLADWLARTPRAEIGREAAAAIRALKGADDE